MKRNRFKMMEHLLNVALTCFLDIEIKILERTLLCQSAGI